MTLFRAELLKLATLPSAWGACILTLALPVGLAALSARTFKRALSAGDTTGLLQTSPADIGFGHLIYGSIGVIVLGVVCMSSEYSRHSQNMGRARQISTTMVATPRRLPTVVAKMFALTSFVTVVACVALPTTLLVSRAILGSYAATIDYAYPRRALGVMLYWVMTALISCAFTSITKSGVLPLVLLIANSTVLSLSRLLALVTDLAKYLPDTSAMSMFLTESPVSKPLEPGPAFLLCLVWSLAAASVVVANWVCGDT